MALREKIIAYHLVKEAHALKKPTQEHEYRSEKRTSVKKCPIGPDNQKMVKHDLLMRAQEKYLTAVKLYIAAYDESYKECYLKLAEKIILEKLYNVELEQIATSHIFTISDEKITLFKEIKTRKGTDL